MRAFAVPTHLIALSFALCGVASGAEAAPRICLPFVENTGQLPADVLFHTRTIHGDAFVTRAGELVHALSARDGQRVCLVERPVGGSPARVAGGEPATTRVSFFQDADPTLWRQAVPTCGSVTLGAIWPGIDVELVARSGSVEKVFRLAPGVEPDAICMSVDGGRSLSVDAQGRLVADTDCGRVVFSRPRAFQSSVFGAEEAVPVAYRVAGDSYGFVVGDHDPCRALVIDPLLGATYLGGSSNEWISAITADGGDVYVVGKTQSSDFPTTPGAYDTTFNFNSVIIAKFNSGLTQLLAATFLGSTGDEAGYDVTVAGGSVYVTGRTTSTNFPTTPGAYDTVHDGGTYDAFIARFSTDLSTLQASTLLGGNGGDFAFAIAVSSGSVWVAGHGSSTTFPTTAGAFQKNYVGSNELFVARLSADLSTLTAATYLGGSFGELLGDMVVSGGDVYVTGETRSSDFPVVAGCYDTTLTGSKDVFVSRLTGDLSTLSASTFLGGSTLATTDEEAGAALAVAGNELYVTGWTVTGNFPMPPGGFDTSHNGAGIEDVFVAKLATDLTSLSAASYLGGDWGDEATDLAVTSTHVFLTGTEDSTNFPVTPGAFDPSENGYDQAFVSCLTRDLTTLSASTGLGGSIGDEGRGLVVTSGSVYVTGDTYSNDFPVPAGAAFPTYTKSSDVFIARLSLDLLDQWTDLGLGLAGAAGTPVLAATGSLTSGSAMTLSLTGAQGSATAFLVLGLARLDAPFYGGTLVPTPVSPAGLFVALKTSGAGDLTISAPWPAGIPAGLQIYLQYWIVDPGGPFGFAASNALQGRVP